MATAKKTASGKWRIRVYVGKDEHGKPLYKSFTDSDRRRCERIAAQYLDENRETVKSDSFESAMENYIKSRTPVLSPSTIRGYRNIQKQLRTQYGAFCALSLADIRQDRLQTLVNDMTMFVRPKTIANRYGLVVAVIRENGYMPPKVKLPDRVKPNLTIPDADGVKRILQAAEGTEMEIPILLAAFAPMRRSEIAALEMEDISGNTIHVQRAIVMNENNENVSKSPKTYDSDRYISMPSKIINKIRKKGYVTTIKDPQHISQRFYHIAEKADCHGVRFHDLRHFCASYLHAQGVPEQYILERGGWNTDRVMKSVYRHALASETDRINEKIVENIQETFLEHMFI